MIKTDFTKLINSLNEIYIRNKSFIDEFSIEYLINCDELSIQKFYQNINSYISSTDKLTVDLYHIIGMGNLSSSQTLIYIKTIKPILNQRCILKHLFGAKPSIKQIRSLIKNDIKTTYKTTCLTLNSLINFNI